MPDQKSNVCITFDRDIIRSKIAKLSFKEARRMQGPLYDVLLKELLEEACLNTYKYIKCLLTKEAKLVALNYTSQLLRYEREFFIAVVENLKLAELSIKFTNDGGWLAALKILYQTMIMTQSQIRNYEWFVTDIFDIVINIMKDLDEENQCYNELKMRIYYKYALYQKSKDQRFKQAIEYFYKAFELSKGELWAPDSMPEMERFKTMYEAIPQKLASVLLKQGKKLLNKSPEAALDMANQAVCALSTVSWKENKFWACKAILTKVLYMMECQKYEMALSDIIKVQPYIIKELRSEFFRLQCEIFLYKGQCYYNLNDSFQAMISYRSGYMLSRKYNLRDMQAELLLSIGRAYGKSRRKLIIALDAYIAARKIFVARGDYQNKMKTTYLLAKLKTDQLFSKFMSLVKSTHYCEYYKLRQWKNQCKPFWDIESENVVPPAHKLSAQSSVASKKTILDDDDDNVQESDTTSGSTSDEMVETFIDSELNFEQPERTSRKGHRLTNDFFNVRESLRLKSSDWEDTSIGLLMRQIGESDNLNCLLEEFENVESKS